MDANEIEVTPEMIKAGVGALFDRYEEDVFSDARNVVREVYEAMARMLPAQRSPSGDHR